MPDTTTPYRAIPKQPQAQDRRNRILDVAARLVGELGSENVTTIDVAHSAGSSVGSVYRLFPDKHGMLAAVAETHVAAIIGKLPKRFATGEKAAKSLTRILADMNRDAPAFRQLNVGAQITCLTSDGWLQIAELVLDRLDTDTQFQPVILAAALGGANTILAHRGVQAAVSSSIATAFLAEILAEIPGLEEGDR